MTRSSPVVVTRFLFCCLIFKVSHSFCMNSFFPSPAALGTIWKDDFAVGKVVIKFRVSLPGGGGARL